MKTFEFSIVATGLNPEADDFEDRFYESGCDDALLSFQNGCIILDFSRKAETLATAISSALEDVAAAGARAVRVEPDNLATLPEIARRAGISWAAVWSYRSGLRDFPVPVARVTTDRPLLDWAAVSLCLARNGNLNPEAAADAESIRKANEEIERGGCRVGGDPG